MKAIRIHEYGGPEVMRLEDIPTPTPGSGEVLIKLAASGVNFIDTYKRAGIYKGNLPFTVGEEGAGTVKEVGPGVAGFAVGDPVVYANVSGAYAEYQVVPAAKLVKIPAGIDLKVACAAMLQGMTAHYLVKGVYTLKPGDTCLIHAGAGGVGLLLIQMAKQLGATVFATAGGHDKRELARAAGADHVFDYAGVSTLVKEMTGGKGVHVVYDGVGKNTWDESLNSLRMRGMMALYGQASGPVPPIDPQILNQKGGLFLTRPSLWQYTSTREELEFRVGEVMGWIKDGWLNVRIGAEIPLAQAAQAHQKLQGRETTGKVLLIP